MDGGEATITGLTRSGSGALLSFSNDTNIDLSDSAFSDTDRPLTFSTGTTATVRTSSFDGGGTAILSSGSLTVEDCTFTGADTASSLVVTGDTTVRGSTFSGATTSNNAITFGIYADVTSEASELVVDACTFTGLDNGGGGVFANGPVHITGSQFVDLDTNGVWLGDYGNLPFTAADLEGAQVIEDSQFTGTAGYAVRGWLCPTLVDTSFSGSTGPADVSLQSYDGLDCASFGDNVTFSGGPTSANVVLDTDSASLSCDGCSFTGGTVDAAISVDGEGDITLTSGAMTSNTFYTAGVRVASGQVRLEGVDLGAGSTGNVGDEVSVGSTTYDGTGTTTITCTASGCD